MKWLQWYGVVVDKPLVVIHYRQKVYIFTCVLSFWTLASTWCIIITNTTGYNYQLVSIFLFCIMYLVFFDLKCVVLLLFYFTYYYFVFVSSSCLLAFRFWLCQVLAREQAFCRWVIGSGKVGKVFTLALEKAFLSKFYQGN